MGRVFISHAHEDHRAARQVHRLLVEAGHHVFLDVDHGGGIRAGEGWERRLHAELRGADAVVCVVSPSYVASQWCAIEIAVAKSLGTRLVPLSVQPGVLHPLLQELHHLDYAADAAGALAVVDEELRGVAAGGGWPDDRSPFPGLRAFDIDWQRVFFGRERDIAALVALLRSPAEQATGEIVTVVGPSGCGKSSLVRAGLLPAMAREPGWWVLAPVVPGEDPVGALARELAAEAVKLGRSWTIEEVRARLAGASGLAELADEVLVATSGRQRHKRLLLVVDQFEETLTRASAQRRGQFVRLLAQAAAGPVAVVTTLRPEFLDPLLSDPELAELKVRPVAVRPLDTAALTAAVVGPARVAGIGVDDTLVARMVADTGTGEALPLLAFALERLAAEVGRGGRLTPERYDQIGGVTGALSAQADAAMAEARTRSGRGAEEVLAGLLRLVTVDETGRPTRRRVAYSELPDPVRAEVAAFIDRRLLTTDEVDGVVSIGVAHEAFLGAWPPLADAVTKAAVALRTRREVEHAAADWAATGRPQRRLWIRGQLSAAVETLGARLRRTDHRRGRGWFTQRTLHAVRIDLGDTGHQFLHASIRHDRWLRRRSITILSGLLVVAIVAAGIAVVNLRNAQEQQRNAQELQRTVQDQQRLATARQLMARAEERTDGDLRTALQFKLAAHRIHPDAETRMGVFTTLARTPYAGTLHEGSGSGSSMELLSDRRTLIIYSLDGPMVLWDLSDYAHPQRLSQLPIDQTGPPWSMTLSSDGRTLITFSSDGPVVLWDLSDRARPQRLGQLPISQTGPVWSVALASSDGRTLITSNNHGPVVLWDLSDRTHPQQLGQPLTSHTGPVRSVTLTLDGRTLATSNDNTVVLWDLSDHAHPQQLGQPMTGHRGPVRSVAMTPDGHTLATGSDDGMAILWDTGVILDLRDQAIGLACSYVDRGFSRDDWASYVPGLPYQDSCAN